MIDRIFIAALSLCLLAAGTLAIGSAWFDGSRSTAHPARAAAAPRIVRLPVVEVVGKRVEAGTAWARTEASEPAPPPLQ